MVHSFVKYNDHHKENSMSSSLIKSREMPSVDTWLAEAKADPAAENVGMYLTHNGVVRKTAKAKVRLGAEDTRPVTGLVFSYDEAAVEAAIAEAHELPGIYFIRVWLAEGRLEVGDSIMLVLIGGDIRPHVVDCLQTLVGRIKSECVTETEEY